MALLELHNVTKDFGGLRAVDHVSFQVKRGSITALIGPNGAGKTTLFNVITGLLKPTEGQVVFSGTDITGWPPHRIIRLGMSRTFQIPREFMELTVLENVVAHWPVRGVKALFSPALGAEELDKAMSLLEFIGLADLAHAKARDLSYGQRKLLELAAALIQEPQCVLLDEPAAGVNPALLEAIMEHILELNRRGITFLIVEHNMDVVMNLSHWVVVMAYGKLLRQGPPDAIQEDPAVLEAYLGGKAA